MNWFKKLLTWLKTWNWQEPKPPTPIPIPQPDPVDPPVSGEYPELTSTAKGNIKWTDTKETCKITQVDMSKSGPRITSTCNPAWPRYDGKCDGFIAITWMHDWKRQGRYFDWRAIQSPYRYGWKHIMQNKTPEGKDGMFRFDRPQKGDQVGLYFLSTDKQSRSNIYWFEWELSKDANAKD
jgi:hypothetical protein